MDAPADSHPRPSAARAPSTTTAARIRRVLHVVLVAAALLGILASGAPLCPVAAIARHPCPACGLTRASFALLRGDLASAVHLHPLVFFVTPLLGVWAFAAARAYVLTGYVELPARLSRTLGVLLIAAFALLIALWMARAFGHFGGPVPV